jgi:predicted DNA-binding transcriptional regulator YafY
MYHPTTRLLTILELLQTHATLSSGALARRLEVEPRTVRRYIQMLQDMGMPIEASHGPGGGYHLRPGFKLPPLLFSEEEGSAIVLGLLSTAWLQIDQSPVALQGALAKVFRVLPQRARERLSAMTEHLTLMGGDSENRPDIGLLLNLSEAIQLSQRVHISYRTNDEQMTERTVDPYGINGRWGRWYLTGYCHLRQDYRLFRLDRIAELQMRNETFERDPSFDPQEYINQMFINEREQPVVVDFAAPLAEVQRRIPSSYGELNATANGTRFSTRYGHLEGIARFLISLNLPFTVQQPPELRDLLRQIATDILQQLDTQ